MSIALKMPEPNLVVDRPAWIPDHIIQDWNPDPYAYQTEEEMRIREKIFQELTDLREITYVAHRIPV